MEKRVFRKRWMEFPKTVDGIRDDGKDGVGKLGESFRKGV